MLDNLIRQLHGQSEPLYCHACLEFTTFFSIPLDFQDNRYKLGHYLSASPLRELLASIRPEATDLEAKVADTLVFPSPDGKFIDWHNFTNRAWKAILKSLPNIEYRNPYPTHHTFCSLCREADIASIQIAKWVGNSAQMIDRVYAKPTDYIQVPTL